MFCARCVVPWWASPPPPSPTVLPTTHPTVLSQVNGLGGRGRRCLHVATIAPRDSLHERLGERDDARAAQQQRAELEQRRARLQRENAKRSVALRENSLKRIVAPRPPSLVLSGPAASLTPY